MRSVRTLTTATLVAATAFGGLGAAATAGATTKEEVAVNGTFRATSIGDWAQRNDQYFEEPTVVQTWTISSTCDTFQECHGTVTSDLGWTAPLYMSDGQMWKVKHEVPNWERCEDGTAFTGQQTFYFYPVNEYGGYQLGSSTFAGKDKTVGPSGACGQNQWLDIAMPLRLDKLS
ncbi:MULTISPECIES: hypothetical protein [Mycobacterium avium complex (MAC)]|jgi:hypothetical protein|uniref:Secreted protein n=6 Tax=Mycobacterium avium complex (MAC) TaxID=120793 RepID=Q742R9_MYCPA|nr:MULTISPECIES: hypothetical protein [Mycobacterium avium complex (MAC)]ETA91555.1 hypothetical protein O984_16485 [Mycobacterium avium 05-4293]ETA95747.1 hypothetical protein O982_18150 [Mycobacterium avium 10-5581]ETB07481.1 hypothetical protein P863_16605 [Mycobacterium avium subsp. silvaticum ATCC 49884]ETB14587.1 hypothetical protein O972_17605 [Mycobacterium avium subsp. avium 10-9275]ETB19327.1 hypothetical protein O973_16760 [Mycobacterium avium subsp. avium 11-4751]ETB22736.1 hypoth